MPADQSKTPNLDRLREMSARLAGLVSNPECGTMTWNMALDVVLADLAAFRGPDMEGDKYIKSHAQIGASVFAPGVAVSTVIERAYREYQHQERGRRLLVEQSRSTPHYTTSVGMAPEGQEMVQVPRSLMLAVADLIDAMSRRNAR